MVLERKGPVSTATRNCQNHVQRLQGRGTIAPLPSGSQGLDPRTLRPERLKWLSMPHPARPDGRRSLRASASAMGLNATAKSEPAAKIVAFRYSLGFRRSYNSPWPGLTRPSRLDHRLKAGDGEKGRMVVQANARRAFAHHSTTILHDGRKGQGLAGTDPSTFSFRERSRAMS